MRRRLQKSRPSASTAGLQAADETMPNAEFFNDGATIQPLFLARPAGTPSSARGGPNRPPPSPGVPPCGSAHVVGTSPALLCPRSGT